MRLIALGLALLFLALVVWGIYYLTVGQARLEQARQRRQAAWQFRHYAHDGNTVVAVSKIVPGTDEVLEELVLTRFPANDPNWEQLFLTGREEAEQRAFHLNSGGSVTELPPYRPGDHH
jgi:pyridoxamine 5'-phosphate oxidase family protein